MRDELERLEKELKRRAPKLKPEAKKQAHSRAMEAFEKHHQGLSVQPRQTGQEVEIMSWLKQRIHPLQLRYVAAACAMCLAVGGGAATYWLFNGFGDPAEISRIAKLEPEPAPALAAGESLAPPEEDAPAEAAGPAPAAESAPAPPEQPRGRTAKVAVPTSSATAEPTPAAATEGVTVQVTSEAATLSSEAPAVAYADPGQPAAPASPAFPAPPPPPGSAAAFGAVSASRSAEARGQAMDLSALGRSRMRIIAEEPGIIRERGAQSRDRFPRVDPNRLKVAAEEPVSTFSIDVDTASYSFTRASLQQGVLPPRQAVRIEELINYFPYDYPAPSVQDTPFATQVTVLPAPWNPSTRLMHIGIRGFELTGPRPRANLVFLIDTSGSMGQPNKLPLLVNSLRLLVMTFLKPEDRVAVVTYAGSSTTALDPTPVSEREKIMAVLNQLRVRRLHGRRLGDSAGLPAGPAALHRRWGQPGHPGHRR